MAEINPPFALQNAGATHTAENDRVAIGAILAGASGTSASTLTGRGGVAPALGGALAVTVSSGLTVSVASGVAFVPGTQSVKQGVYICTNDAAEAVTLDTAHGSFARIDNIIARVYDSVYSGTTDIWAIEKVTGTAASSPVAPSNPPNSITLANVTVPAAATNLSSGNIADARRFIGQGVIAAKSTDKPALSSIAEGQLISLLDTGDIQMKFGGAYVTKSTTAQVINRQVFTASGTWTKPTNARSVYVQVVGGGGAGGGAAATSSGQASVGSGGGAGGYADAMFDASSISATVTVTVGTGGVGVPGGTGNNGSGSSFGSLVSASGGSGGLVRPASTIAFGIDGGSGGATFTGAQVSVDGGDGASAWGSGQLGISGSGGASFMSGQAKGQKTTTASQRVPGWRGKPWGGGGSGGVNSGSVAAIDGGDGENGIVIVTTYF